jgi:large subunit ribosomal protein L25
MAETVVLATQPRDSRGTHKARQLRKKGLVPAVVYGHKQETLSVAVSAEELTKAVRHGVRVLDLQTNGAVEKALIRELQYDHLGKELLHVDFARVSADERVHVSVKVELRGVAPGVTHGGALDQPLHVLPIECLAISIPDSIRVNVGELVIGQAIHVRDLVLPEGVKALADPDAIVVHVTVKQVEAEPTPAAPAAEAAEPEVIGRKPEEGEEEEEKKEKEKK